MEATDAGRTGGQIEFGPPGRMAEALDSAGCLAELKSEVESLQGFVARRVANPADAQDLAQQALLLACARTATFRGENLRGWLFAIARHLIVDHYRKTGRSHFVALDEDAGDPAWQSSGAAAPVVCALRERIDCWALCISKRLHLEEQVAVLQADIYGYRDREGATALDMSEASYKLLLHGARAHLRAHAAGTCAAVRMSEPCPCETNSGSGRPPSPEQGLQSRRSPRVRCPLSHDALIELRRRLLTGLSV
jgi:RNA polymerase sigma-70 factor, ECF subfamily